MYACMCIFLFVWSREQESEQVNIARIHTHTQFGTILVNSIDDIQNYLPTAGFFYTINCYNSQILYAPAHFN